MNKKKHYFELKVIAKVENATYFCLLYVKTKMKKIESNL